MSKMRHRWKSMTNYRSSPETFPNCVIAETQFNPIENNLRRFQFVTSAKFNSIWLKKFQDMSKLCLSRKSIASCWKYSKTFPNLNLRRSSIATYRNYSENIPKCVLAENEKQASEIILRQIQNQIKIVLKVFQNLS